MTNVFTVKGLRYRYPKAPREALKGLDFEVREGEIFGLLGPSGAGKSTTQKILTKLLENYEGTVSCLGEDLRKTGRAYYERIGVGFEMPVHFTKLTAMENLKFFQGFYKKTADIEDLLTRVGLWEHRDIRVGEYSKGMKVRLNFVRAMINMPQILFLDEVTNGLDPVNARVIKDMIAEFRKNGGTVFLTTHLMSDVEQLCDRVAFCVEGKLSEVSTPRELKLRYGTREVTLEYREGDLLNRLSFPMAGIGANDEFIRILREKEIETLHSGETSMEEIFIRVTGVKAV